MGFVEFNNVKYTYNAKSDDEVVAVDGVSFKIEEKKFTVILGANGSGKSTIARLMNGLLTPESGTITVDGIDTKDKKQRFEVRRRVGVVFQNPDNQMVSSIIEDDVAFGPENLGLKIPEIRERVDWALAAVSMKEHALSTPFRLSGGQKQRIAIAGVLAMKPRIIVLDEATAMLDPKGRKEVLEVASRLKDEEGIGIVLITHFMEEALLADNIIVLSSGKIVLSGEKSILLEEEKLEQHGLKMPFAARVASRLRNGGIKLPPNILNKEELIEELCSTNN